MKLTAFIMLVTCLQTSATGIAQQTITFSGKEVSLENVFAAIKKQTNYKFFFNIESIHHARTVTLEVKNASIEQVLTMALKDQPFTYTIKGRTVFIIQKKEDEKSSSLSEVKGDPVTVTGRVVDDQGQPLVGANVKIKGTAIGVTTDKDGLFKLTNVDADATLEISFVGHETQVIPVRGKSFFAINLAQKLSLLDETQVIAYGTTTRRFSTGNVGSIRASDIETQPVNNPLLALEGKVAGLFISQSTGVSGGSMNVRIQGQNSISNGNDPLYVIDGIPYPSQLLANGGLSSVLGLSGNGSNGNPLFYLNPMDIERIDVLKDADATAIYGSRAANGAILITTKRGKAGKMKIDINLQHGWSKVTRKVNMLNTEQYLEMRREAKKNDNLAVLSTDYDLNGVWDTTRYTDWQKQLIGGTAENSIINVNVSGGTELIQYLVGGTYSEQSTVFPGSLKDEKGAVHFSLTSASSDRKFRFQLSGNFITDNNKLPFTDLTGPAIRLEPNAPNLFNDDGSVNWALSSTGVSSWSNPIVPILYNTYSNKTNNLIGSLSLSYSILPGLDLKSNIGYNDLQSTDFSPTPILSIKPERRASTLRSAIYGDRRVNLWNVEPQIIYKARLLKGQMEALLGMTFMRNTNSMELLSGSGYNSDLVLEDIKSATSISAISSSNAIYKYNALFGRLNYNWKDKYIFDLTARRDGSSRFGSENKFHNFGSLGVAWIFSKENIFKRNFNFFSFGKLRASFGKTGNDQLGDYKFMSLYENVIGIEVPYQGGASLAPAGISNPYLQWEETKKLQLGTDLAFISDHIVLSVTYADNRSSNQLLQYSLPSIAGFTSINENFPATVQNVDWEFTLATKNINEKNFSWETSFNLTIPRNKLLRFTNLENSTYASLLVIGQPLNIIKAYHFQGVDPAKGLYQMLDENENPTFAPDPKIDRTVLINTLPKFYGGLQNNFHIKGFDVNFLFQFVKQVGVSDLYYWNGSRIPGRFFPGSSNQSTTVLQRWQKPDDVAAIQRFTTSNLPVDILQSNAVYRDASYIRLKNVFICHNIASNMLRKIHLQGGRIYVQGQNVLTLTNYKGMDPENQSLSYLPPLRTISVGLQVTF
jgi:TonB-linked SusC/RagA family outer membrane protein